MDKTISGEDGVRRFLEELPGEFTELYEWSEILGVGGQGFALRGMQRKLRRPVVIKFLLRGGADAERRFLAEARILSSIRNPHVIRLYDFGHVKESLYLVLEYLPGRTLFSALIREFLSLEQVVGIARDVAVGLVSIHREGIVHRDLKPSNLWYAEGGRTKILDFGIARFERGESLTAAGSFMGTPAYAAPEQIASEPVDGRTDLYSLGVILYELVTGVNPFLARTLNETVNRQMSLQIDSVPRGRLVLPAGLENLVVNLLRKSPALRIPDAVTMIERLDREVPPRSDGSIEVPQPEPEELKVTLYPGSFFRESPDHDGATPRVNAPPRKPCSLPVPGPPPRRWGPLAGIGLVLVFAGVLLWLSSRSSPAPHPVPPSPRPSLAPVIFLTSDQVDTSRALIGRVKDAGARNLQAKTRFEGAQRHFDVSRLGQLDAEGFTDFLELMKELADHRARLDPHRETESISARDLCLLTALEGWHVYVYFRAISLRSIAGGEFPPDFPTPALATAFRAVPPMNGADSLFKVRRFLHRAIETIQLCERAWQAPDTLPEFLGAIGEVGRTIGANRWRDESWSSMSQEIDQFEQAILGPVGPRPSAGTCTLRGLLRLSWAHRRGAQTVTQLAASAGLVTGCLQSLEEQGRITTTSRPLLLDAVCGSEQ